MRKVLCIDFYTEHTHRIDYDCQLVGRYFKDQYQKQKLTGHYCEDNANPEVVGPTVTESREQRTIYISFGG